MPDEDLPKSKKRGWIRIMFSLATLALLSYITISLISGRGLGFGWLVDMFATDEYIEVADEFHFNIGRGRVFSDLDNAIVAAGSLGIQVLDYSGTETLRDSFQMSAPAIYAKNGRAVVFDIGGMSARAFSANEIIASITTNGPIVSASINSNGWFIICAQESGGFRGNASVYNDNGNLVYRVSLSSGYILSAALSPDNGSLAVLNLTDNGSRVTFYHDLDKEEPDQTFDLPDELIIDVHYLENGDLLAITTDSLIVVDPIEGAGWVFYGFSGMRLGGYAIDESFIALHLLDFGIGHRGRILIVDLFGNHFGEALIERELISMSFRDGYLAAMLNDGLVFYDRGLAEIPLSSEFPYAAGGSRLLSLKGGAALVAGDHFAVVVRPTIAAISS